MGEVWPGSRRRCGSRVEELSFNFWGIGTGCWWSASRRNWRRYRWSDRYCPVFHRQREVQVRLLFRMWESGSWPLRQDLSGLSFGIRRDPLSNSRVRARPTKQRPPRYHRVPWWSGCCCRSSPWVEVSPLNIHCNWLRSKIRFRKL